MSRKKIRIIIVLATLALVGLITVQLLWLNKAYNSEEQEFNLAVKVALTHISRQLTAESQPANSVKPIKQVSSSFYLAEVNGTVRVWYLKRRRRYAGIWQLYSSHLKKSFGSLAGVGHCHLYRAGRPV
jgi:hypothetical protein